MAFLEEVAEYAKIDLTEENAQVYIDAAETYLTNTGATKDEANAIYKLAVKMLVTHWHDNRVPSGNVDTLPFGLSGIITQLKYCYPAVTT